MFKKLLLALALVAGLLTAAAPASAAPVHPNTCVNPDEVTGWFTGPGSTWESSQWVYVAEPTTRTTTYWCAVADVRDLVFGGTSTQLRLDVWPGGGTGFTSFQPWVTCPRDTSAWCRVSASVPFSYEYRVVSKVAITDGHVRMPS